MFFHFMHKSAHKTQSKPVDLIENEGFFFYMSSLLFCMKGFVPDQNVFCGNFLLMILTGKEVDGEIIRRHCNMTKTNAEHYRA